MKQFPSKLLVNASLILLMLASKSVFAQFNNSFAINPGKTVHHNAKNKDNKRDLEKKIQNDSSNHIAFVMSIEKLKNQRDSLKNNFVGYLDSKKRIQHQIDSTQAIADSLKLQIDGNKKLLSQLPLDIYDANIVINSNYHDSYTKQRSSLVERMINLKPEDFKTATEFNAKRKPLSDSVDILTGLLDSLDNQTKIEGTKKFLDANQIISPFFTFNTGKDIPTIMQSIFSSKQIGAFQNLSTQVHKTTFINAELANAVFGKFRLGLSAFIKASGDTAKDKIQTANLQKLISSGASFSVNALTPLMNIRSQNNNSHFGVYFQVLAGFSPIDSNGFTQSFNYFKFISNEGLLLRYDIWGTSISDNLKNSFFFVEMPLSYYWGSKDYLSSLAIADFSAVQISIGIMFKNSFSLKVNGPLLSTSKAIQSSPWNFSIQVSPSSFF